MFTRIFTVVKLVSDYTLMMATKKAALKKRHGGKRARVRRGNEDDAARLRIELLNAASTLFSKGGLNAVTVRGVAALVGLSPMAIYRYFSDKGQLLAGLWHFVIRALCDGMLDAVARAPDDPRARLRASLDSFLAYWEANPDHYRLVYMTETTSETSRSVLTQVPAYLEIVALAARVAQDFAAAIGAPQTHLKLASDVRFAMLVGFLHGTMVTRRYAWSDVPPLRAAYIEQIIAAMERCMLDGPGSAKSKSSPKPRPAAIAQDPMTAA